MADRRWLPPALALALAAGCAGGGAQRPVESVTVVAPTPSTSRPLEPSPSSVPRFLIPSGGEQSFTMVVGQSATLALADPAEPEPRLDGAAVLLIVIADITATTRREWEVRAVAPGVSTIRGTGDSEWVITLTVT